MKLQCQVILEQTHDVFRSRFVLWCSIALTGSCRLCFTYTKIVKMQCFYKLTCLQCKLPCLFANNNHQSRQLQHGNASINHISLTMEGLDDTQSHLLCKIHFGQYRGVNQVCWMTRRWGLLSHVWQLQGLQFMISTLVLRFCLQGWAVIDHKSLATRISFHANHNLLYSYLSYMSQICHS